MKPLILLALTTPLFAANCAELAQLALPDAKITLAQTVPAGTFTPPGGRPIPNLPAFCRVATTRTPTSDSDIRLEVWLPLKWNGNFLGLGNGGFAGLISYGPLADSIRQGFAAASTDTGHVATPEATWALNHPEKIADFGHRSIHLMTVHAKALATTHYGKAPLKSYFSSCSNGGRQALMEAQRYPADYDGIIAGAPANAWTSLLSTAAKNMQATGREPAAYIPAAKLPAIQAAALAACDQLDGVKDGVLENPTQCRFNPASLLCTGPETNQCLTAPQVDSLRTLYAGLRAAQGKPLFPGYSPSGEAEPGGWGSWITGPAPEKSALYGFSTNFFRYLVYSDPTWDYKTFDVTRDLAAAQKLAPALDATNPDLKAFHARGGKLILYHGWCDAAIPAQNSIDYYQAVVKKMGAKRAATFVRLFMAPGVQHCGGGTGPNNFGQGGAPQGDAASNIAAALVQWAEKGAAPEQIIAAKPGRSRPLCAYPKVARYKGTGSTDEAANFTCAAP